MGIDKYFLAIVLPEPLQQEVMVLKEYVKEHFNSKAALRSPAHITLHMPFEWKSEKEETLIETLQKFKFKETFQIELKNFSCFEPRVVYVDVIKNETLNQLQKELVKHVRLNLNLLNEAQNMRGFHPHATIAFRDLNKNRFNQAWEHFKHQTYNGAFTAGNLHLLKHSPGKWEVYREFPFF
ncbi:MAG TPA: RNA 2',3'-cyclic phosphodiesterase [Bacteroidia bacterium]|jgi:2'-5' RNA ligase|nr:RNA 2',3'-cyclic phosphodiesterase [Bacteroidia bacterium]